MKSLLLFFLGCLCYLSPCFAQTKIACLGNSITYGATIQNRAQNCYPALLQAMLGDTYQVNNYGRSGATLLRKGDLPYLNTNEFRAALAFNPDIVFIKLGTNDSKSFNRIHLSEFIADYNTFIDTLRRQNPNVRLILLTPLRAFNQPDTLGITASVIENQITPLIEQVAYQRGLEIIHPEEIIPAPLPYLIPDKIHPSSIGSGRIAAYLYTYLLADCTKTESSHAKSGSVATENFHGFDTRQFELDGVGYKIIYPRHIAHGKPWIRQTTRHTAHPLADCALLEQGFHIVCFDSTAAIGKSKWERKLTKTLKKEGLTGTGVPDEKYNGNVKAILEATGHAVRLTDKAIPGTEFRASAGWVEGADWQAHHREISSLLQNTPLDLLLIGNSITQGFGGDRTLVAYKPGKKALDTALAGKKWQAAGIAGDRTENVLYRLMHGNYNSAHPKNVVLTIGINNLGDGNSAAETFAGIQACIETIARQLPDSKLTVFAIFPARKEPDAELRQRIVAVNRLLSDYAVQNQNFRLVDLTIRFLQPNGELNPQLYSADCLHLSAAGYEMWSNEIASLLQ